MIVRGEETLKLSSTILPRLTTELACESKTSGTKKEHVDFSAFGAARKQTKVGPLFLLSSFKKLF